MNKHGISIVLAGTLALSLTGCTEEYIEVVTDPLTVRTIYPSYKDFTTTGSAVATIEPGKRTTVVPMVSGEIQGFYVSKGDYVSAGTVICTVDSDPAVTQMENAEDSILRAQENLESILEGMLVKAPVSGYVHSIDGKLNYAVNSSSQLAFLNNQRNMTVKVPFLDSFVDASWIGQTADLSFVDTGENLIGTVTEISGTAEYLYTNIAVNYITISVANPGSIQAGRRVAAEVNGITCSGEGEFEAVISSPVTCGLNGTLEAIYVNVGDYVNAGDTMFRVVSTTTDNQILNAENSIQSAVDAYQDAVDAIADYTITAPIAGTVSEVHVGQFDQVSGTSALIEISTTNDIEFSFSVTETVLPYLSVGQSLELTAVSGTARGVVTNISNMANSSTGLFTITGKVSGNAILSGTVATVEYQDYLQRNALIIPFEAVQFIGDQAYVFVVEDDIAVKREVILSKYNQDEVIVLSGIDTNDRLISTWSSQLRNGIEVTEEEPDENDGQDEEIIVEVDDEDELEEVVS